METVETVRVAKVFFPKDKKKKVLLYANLEFFGCLEIRNWRLFLGSDGKSFEVGYPNAPMVNGATKFYRQVIPSTPQIQKEIHDTIVGAYQAALKAKEEGYAVH